jgi:serine phosphatase RsbU (regulator of sigma subunit)
MYGDERLNSVAAQNGDLSPGKLIAAYLEDLREFQTDKRRSDDLTLMVVRRG